jgi:very-short-patch-repair endonuclease/DNA polymerase III delta prime subunit
MRRLYASEVILNSEMLEQLELTRKELLDMGLRGNTLLNYRPSKKSLDIINERSTEVFNQLVNNEGTLGFNDSPDSQNMYETENEDDLLFIIDNSTNDKKNKSKLQTNLNSNKLGARLLKIENESKTLLQERGIEVLYLAVGFLKWYEDESSNMDRYAPLVLIPVEFKRTETKRIFKIVHTGADINYNVTLYAKLKSDFGVKLLEPSEETTLEEYFDYVRNAVSGLSRWEVIQNNISLGLFAFGQYQMYVDLDHKTWPDGFDFSNNNLLLKLFGKTDASFEDIDCREISTKYIESPELLHLIKDADPTQIEAVSKVLSGANLIIQGPPGTGKSQTITNIIAEALASDKKILFVAQKMAALEVVKKRLDDCNLGSCVLELHSHKSNKRSVLESIQNTLNLGYPKVPDRTEDLRRLNDSKRKLNSYAQAVSKEVLKSGYNYPEVIGLLDKYKEAEEYISANELSDELRFLNKSQFIEVKRIFARIEDYFEERGYFVDNPFNFTFKREVTPEQVQRISELSSACLRDIIELSNKAKLIADEMKFVTPETIELIDYVFQVAYFISDLPDCIDYTSEKWLEEKNEITKTLDAYHVFLNMESKIKGFFKEDLAGSIDDVENLRNQLSKYAAKRLRVLYPGYHFTKIKLKNICKYNNKITNQIYLGWLDELIRYKTNLSVYKAGETLLLNLLGDCTRSDLKNISKLKERCNSIITIHQTFARFKANVKNICQHKSKYAASREDLEDDLKCIKSLRKNISEFFHLTEPSLNNDSIIRKKISVLEELLSLCSKDTGKMYDAVRFNRITDELLKFQLKKTVDLVSEWDTKPGFLTDVLCYSYFNGLALYAINNEPALLHFDRIDIDRVLKEFKEIDKALTSYSQEELVQRLHQSLPSKSGIGEIGVISKELGKKTRHMPIRRLLSEAGNAVQQIKPVFMMSPISVATFLEQGKIDFDLVIFDEASQIPAPEAIGAIVRSRQLLVVGDDKQLPPTNFFKTTMDLEEEEADESTTADIESLLSLMITRGCHESMLRWHYRSKHHSLIAVSNNQFYNNSLLVFPGSGTIKEAFGLKFKYCPDTFYDRGKSKTNRKEAHHVAAAVLKHIRETPHLSLGVVAFNIPQKDILTLEIEKMRRDNPDIESFFNEHTGVEEFFVKNLENVQGDERDVIFISVGYGKTEEGHLSTNFGPINRDGGERRLNVLFTRARFGIKLFANFKSEDIITTGSSAKGVTVLKKFLDYAEMGKMLNIQETGSETESPFEDSVKREIEKLGYIVEPQVSSQNFRIDLAVRDPQKPGRYVLAVECDGATYHSSASVRERDRLRQEILEGFGWKFHRIWSTDWFRNKNKEIERLEKVIEQAVLESSYSLHLHSPVKIAKPEINRINTADRREFELPNYKLFNGKSNNNKLNTFCRLIAKEQPVLNSFALRRMLDILKLNKTVNNKLEIEYVFRHAVSSKKVLESEGVFYVEMQNVSLRSWEGLSKKYKKLDYVSDLEISAVLQKILKEGFSVERDEAMRTTLKLLGFGSLTKNARDRLEDIITKELINGRIKINNEKLCC